MSVEFFAGTYFLRFFPNRKNSQNIVPANNSNIKVGLFRPFVHAHLRASGTAKGYKSV